jgi:hypothetical protein
MFLYHTVSCRDISNLDFIAFQCCKGFNETPNQTTDQVMSRLCHNCGSKTTDSDRSVVVCVTAQGMGKQ